MKWQQEARMALAEGRTFTVQPRGNSMGGIIADSNKVTLAPCDSAHIQLGDVVLARVQGKRYRHIVLHQIHAIEAGRLLVGGSVGRLDGWISAEDVFGRVVEIEANGA